MTVANATTTDDWTLLRNYARDRDEESFARLVARYADLTFHTALRRTRDRQLAEDVTQAVFIALARSAGSLRATGSLAAWLHKTTLFASSAAMRAESRRRKRELASARRETVDDSVEIDETTAAIEDELDRLPQRDRDLLAMHYLEGRTMHQTADALQVSLEAARKRLTRALDKIRTRLRARGVTLSTAGIGGAIGTISASMTTSHAPAQIATTLLAGGSSGQAFSLASRIVYMMRLSVLRKAIATTVAIGLVPTTVIVAVVQLADAEAPPPREAAIVQVTFAQASPPSTAPSMQPADKLPRGIALPSEIRRALVRNAEQIGPITLACTFQSSSTYTKERAMSELKLREHEASFNAGGRHEYRMEWQDHKYRGEFRAGEWPGMPVNHVKSQHLIGAFDGETIHLIDVRERAEDPTIRPRASVTFRVPLSVTPTPGYRLDNRGWTHGEWYFNTAGWRLPLSIGELKFNTPPRSEILYMLDEAGATLTAVDRVQLDQRECVRLTLVTLNPDRKRADETDPDEWAARMKREGVAESDENLEAIANAMREERKLPKWLTHDIYLDPALGYAVRRTEKRYSLSDDRSVLLTRVDCSEFQQLAERELFLPRALTSSLYTSNMLPGRYFDEPTVTGTFRVTTLQPDPIPGERFTPKHEQPGDEIVDILDSDGKRRHVVIQDDGSAREEP